jgi:hypothetical protein
MTPRPDSLAARVLSDPAASYWLKDAVRALMDRDACDALNDAEALREVARDHYQLVARKP